MKGNISILLTILFLSVACNFQGKKTYTEDNEASMLPPLDSGVVYYQFDTLFHLTGEKILNDSLIHKFSRIFVKDNQLIFYGFEWDFNKHLPKHKFCYFSLPAIRFLKYEEDYLPNFEVIISTPDTTLLCYLWSKYDQRLYKYDLSGKIEAMDAKIPFKRQDIISSVTHIGNEDFIYLKDTSIIRTTIAKDTVIEKKLYDLTMRPGLGSLVINVSKNRMAFAYRYYQLIHIMDLEAKTVKTIDFKNGNHHYEHNKRTCMDCVDRSIRYYCDAFAGDDYFYVLYWGHSYLELFNHVGKGWRWAGREKRYVKTEHYQQNLPNIVEQYDWNGNPVARYLLEGDPVRRGEGHFFVDEKEQRFYIVASECYATFMATLMCGESLIAYSYKQN